MDALNTAKKQAKSKELRLHKHHMAKANVGTNDMMVSKVITANVVIGHSPVLHLPVKSILLINENLLPYSRGILSKRVEPYSTGTFFFATSQWNPVP